MGILKDLGKETLKFWTTDSRKAGDVNAESAKQLGYEFICRGYNGGRCAGGLFTKDGGVYYAPRKNSIGSSPGQDLVIENITAVEIAGVAEITKNAKLVALEVRYRINGAINSMQIDSGLLTGLDTNALLTIKDKLLNDGYVAAPSSAQSWQDAGDSPAFCGQCGAPSKPGTKFCSKCGASLQ